MIIKIKSENNKNIFDFLTSNQMRHVTILESMVKVAQRYKTWRDEQLGHDMEYAALDVLKDLANMLECKNYGDYSEELIFRINEDLFKKFPTSNDNQNIVYLSALATSKWHLEKLLNN